MKTPLSKLNCSSLITQQVYKEIIKEMELRKTSELFLLFSMGSQYDQLIKLALDKLGVFCLVANPATITSQDVKRVNPIGIILSGGPASVRSNPPPFDYEIFNL